VLGHFDFRIVKKTPPPDGVLYRIFRAVVHLGIRGKSTILSVEMGLIEEVVPMVVIWSVEGLLVKYVDTSGMMGGLLSQAFFAGFLGLAGAVAILLKLEGYWV